MKQILAISRAITKTLWRKKIAVYGMFFLATTLIILNYFSPEARISFSGFTTHVTISFFLIVSLILIFSFLSGITLISSSFEDWSIHLIKVRPIRGFNYFLGYTLGLGFTMTFTFLLTTLLTFIIIFTNYSQLPKMAKTKVLNKFKHAERTFNLRNVDFEELAEQQLKQENIKRSSDQIYLRSRQLKVASHELMVHEEKELVFKNIPTSAETNLKFKLKISGDVFGVKRVFSQLKLIYTLPHKKISTATIIKFESSKPVTIKIPATVVSEDGTVKIGLVNMDKNGRSFYLNSKKGVRLTQSGSGLPLNVVKFILLSFLNILLFSAGGLLLGLMFSSAVSFFFSFTYFTIATFTDLGILPESLTKVLHLVFRSPFSLPFVPMLSQGQFISFFWLLSYTAVLSLEFICLLFVAHLIYSRREVAAVMRTR